MVTQDAAVLPKVNKMKMKKMKKKSKKKKLKGANNLDSESEADKVDLDQKIYPLSHYISDQEELVNQMFLTISGSKLEAMLPPVLKSTPLTELKRLCLHELRGMSKKRILCSINGEVMEGSSGSEDEEDDKEEAAAGDSTTQNDVNNKGEKRKPGDDEAPESYLLKKIKVEPGLEDSTGSGEGKSVLELLELEMRARIIKTMLEKGDEGKKITEDAIAAVMQSAKHVEVSGGNSKEAANVGAESKGDSQEKKSDREAVNEEEVMEERSRGRRRGHGKEGDRRRHHCPAGVGRRNSSRSQKRGDGYYSDEGSCGRNSKKLKESNSSEKHMTKKKKLTRKEFEERMKRAKKNRTYRQRKSSEDEEKTEENEDKPEENSKEDGEKKTEDEANVKKKVAPTEGKTIQDKADGEASEKEEGEIDSNEEEEGACSPTDISSASQYSSSSSYSRSQSRSYSRSLSRSPYRGRQKRGKRSRSRSRSRRRRRSYSRSYSRSRSPERRRNKGDYKRRSYERKRSREPVKSNSKKDIKKSSPAEDRSPSREEDWGHKCDIEFVDSEEDFDDNPEATKKDAGAKKTVTASLNRIERASISFSLQKKPVGIAQSVDLDDLPLKKKETADDIEAVAASVKAVTNEEIVISSDSEVELEGSTKIDSKEQTEKLLVTSVTSSRLDTSEKTVISPIKKDVNSQRNQQKIAREAGDSETKIEPVVKGTLEKGTEESSKLTTDTIFETCTKEVMNVIDKSDSKEESHGRDFKASSESMDGTEGINLTAGDSPKDGERENRDISDDNKQEGKSELSRTDPAEAFSDRSKAESKQKSSDSLLEAEQDDDATETHFPVVGDENSLSETEMAKSSSKKFEKRTGREVKSKVFTALHLLEEEDQTEAEAPVSNESKSHACKDTGVESKEDDTCVDSEREENMGKNDSSVTSEQEEADDRTVATAFGDQSEKELNKGTEQLRCSEDKKESEKRIVKELHRKRTSMEPIRLETGLIRRRVQPSRKIEMIVPEKSWMKRDKKKKEKTKDVLAMEGVGLLKSTLSEGVQSSSQESELERETSQSTEPMETLENKEVPVQSLYSLAPVSDNENSQPLEDTVPQNVASPSPKRDTSPEASQSEDKSLRKVDHNTEIIGVIETSKGDSFDDMELGGSSWSMRWLQSEKVQKVVTSSKMMSRVRKKIQKKEKATKVVMAERVEEAQKPTEPVVSVIGSIEEYERLFGTKVKKDEAAGAAGSASQYSLEQGQTSQGTAQAQGDIPEAKEKSNPVFGSDDDGEDSEEEALWSKIIKK